jgi:hypothetical protein
MDRRTEASNSMTVEEYLALDEASSVKHEYVGGEVHALGSSARSGPPAVKMGRRSWNGERA